MIMAVRMEQRPLVLQYRFTSGTWVRFEGNPVLRPSDNPEIFDSMRVDDTCDRSRRKILDVLQGPPDEPQAK